MNINIQKFIRCTTSILAVLAVVLLSFPTPASALDSYQPENYLTGDIKVDGDIKTVTYLFDNGYPLTNLWSQPSGSKLSYSGQFSYVPRDGTTSFTTRTYFLGKEAYDGQTMPAYSSVDVGDILELAPVSISSKFSIQLTDFSGVLENIGSYSVRYSIGFFAYDANGDYIGTFYGANETKEMNSNQVFDFVARYDASLPSGIKYMLPFISGAFTKTGIYTVFDQTNIQFRPWYFQMDVDINMIYEQSQTMQRIEEEIGEVGDKIDDTNDKLDGIDDTLEDIYTGGESATEASEHIKDVNEDIDGFEELLDDKEKLEEKLPTAPSSFENVIDDAVLDSAITDAGKIMDWEASGLNRMFAPMGLSVGLSILFYVVFGKKV